MNFGWAVNEVATLRKKSPAAERASFRDKFGGGLGRCALGPLVFGRPFPLRFCVSTPPFWIFVVHLFHLLRDVRMILGYVLNHFADHFIP